MNLFIVIATHNRAKLLNRVCRQIHELIVPQGVTIRVVVVDDGSTDETSGMLRDTFPEVIVVTGNGSWWWTKCMNAGFNEAIKGGASHVLILNDDCEVKKDYLNILLSDFNSLHPESVLASVSMNIEDELTVEFAGTRELKKWRMKAIHYLKPYQRVPAVFSGVHPTHTMNGRGTLIPVSIFKKIGLFDEKLPQYGSDDEFAIRARRARVPVCISWNARVYNHTQLTSEGAAFRKPPLIKFIKSFFNRYSVNSISKTAHLYSRHGSLILTPLFVLYFVLATTRAYLFKYRNR